MVIIPRWINSLQDLDVSYFCVQQKQTSKLFFNSKQTPEEIDVSVKKNLWTLKIINFSVVHIEFKLFLSLYQLVNCCNL